MNSSDTKDLYLDLLKKALMDVLQSEREHFQPLGRVPNVNWKVRALKRLDATLQRKGFAVMRKIPSELNERMEGRGVWPEFAQTMVGMNRLNNIQSCIEDVIKNNIEGDLIETGVWRGGSTIFMRAVLRVYGVANKVVWVADSFEGLPKPDVSRYPADEGDTYYTHDELKVTIDDVRANFRKYGMLDDQVKFLKGWFRDTLPTAPINKLSVLRLDGDMYESTMDALVHLYPKLSVGGYIIVDDYRWIEACREAVNDFRSKHDVHEEIRNVDWTAVYWQKLRWHPK